MIARSRHTHREAGELVLDLWESVVLPSRLRKRSKETIADRPQGALLAYFAVGASVSFSAFRRKSMKGDGNDD